MSRKPTTRNRVRKTVEPKTHLVRKLQPHRHLVIGDCHVGPGQYLDRFVRLGKAINDIKPTHIIQIGDFSDCLSLGLHDNDKPLNIEGRRWQADVQSVHEALELIEKTVKTFRWGRENWNNKKIKRHLVYGNHEQRVITQCQRAPQWDGWISVEDLKYKQYGWRTTPFLEELVIDGVAYIHYQPNDMGRAFAGIHHAHNMAQNLGYSTTVGHSHKSQYRMKPMANGSRIHVSVVGCFIEPYPLQDEDYAPAAVQLRWDRGLEVKDNVMGGGYDYRWIRMESLIEQYPCKPIKTKFYKP